MVSALRKKTSYYVSGHSALALSESFYDFVFAALAFKISGSALIGGSAYALGYLAEIFVSLFCGGFLDYIDRKKFFNITMTFKFTTFLTFILLSTFYTHFDNQNNSKAILVLAFAFLIDMIHHTSRLMVNLSSFQIFDPESQIKVQGLVTSMGGVSKISAPIIAGSLLSWTNINIENLLVISLVLQLVAFFALKDLFLNSDQILKGSRSEIFDLLLGTAKTIYKSLSNSNWRQFLILQSIGGTFIGTVSLLFFPLFRGYFHFDEQQCGILLASSAIGMIIGGFFLNPIYRIFSRYEIIVKASLFLSGAMCAIFASLIPSLAVMILTVIVFSTCTVSFFRSLRLILVSQIEKKDLGKWWTASDFVACMSGMIGVMLGSSIMDHLGAPILFKSIALILCISSAIPISKLTIRE